MSARSRRDSNRSADVVIHGPARLAAAALLAAAGVGGLAFLAAGPSVGAAKVAFQAQLALPVDAPPDAAQGKESTEPVYVRDSAIAREKLDLAVKMERLKEWNKSADVYQEVLEKYHDRVVPDGTDAKGVINRYTSVSKKVLAQVCKWPQDGLDVYRARYEPKAAELVNSAGPDDLFALHKAFDLYFPTDSGKVAGLRLMDAHLERGEYAAAAWIGDQMLDTHPRLLTERPAVLFRTALAYALSGNAPRAAERAGKLAGEFPKEIGVVRGRDVVLAEALPSLLKEAAANGAGGGTGGGDPDAVAAANVSGSDAWPMVGGNPSRSLISPAKASAGTRLFAVPLAKAEYKSLTGSQRQTLQSSMEMAAQNGMLLGIQPVADRGELFFQDGARIYAVSLDSGLPLPGWQQTYGGGGQNGQYAVANAWGPARSIQQTLTLTDRHVLGVMGQPDRQSQMVFGMAPTGEPRLVCLDRTSGRELWTASLSSATDVPKNDDEKAVRALQLSGAPLVVGDNVLVIGRSTKPGQGEDCYVLAFNLANGRYRWGCYVASSGMGAAAMMGVPVPAGGGGDNTSHLAYADGRVYVLTNLGAIAALDAYSGTIAWLNIYPLDLPAGATDMGRMRGFNPMFGQQPGSGQARLKPWMHNPVVVQGGRLFMLPTEGKHLMVYDAGSGQEIKRINLEQLGRWSRPLLQPDRITTLVGVQGDRLVVAGDTRVLCLNWRKYDEAKFPGEDQDMVFWPSGAPGAIRGRAFMTADSVYIPCEDRLRRIDMATGRDTEDYPAYPRTWENGEGPGNVLVTGDHVVLAGANSVGVYTDLGAATHRLDREIAAAPTDPDPRLRYAEVMFVAGRPDAALARLDEAIGLLGGLERMQAGPARDRAFADALTFAQKSLGVGAGDDHAPAPAVLEPPANSPAAARVVHFFDRAAAAASDPLQQVRYRLSRAKFAEAARDPAAAVALYQQVLTDASMRAVTLVDEQAGNAAQAEDVVERAIDALVRSAGPSVYAPYQEQAARAADDARAEPDGVARAVKLLRVAQVYPNSGVAPAAMLAAADAYESAGQPREAIRVLRQMWFKDAQAPIAAAAANRPQIVEGIARNYLAVADRSRTDMVSTAAARLAQGVQIAPDAKLAKPLKLADGRTVADAGATFAQALEAVRKVGSQEADRTLPDFRLKVPTLAERARPKRYPKPFAPPPGAASPVLEGATSLVLPAREFARTDRVLAWGPDGLGIYAAGQTKPLAVNKSFGGATKEVAGGGEAPTPPRGVAWAAGDVALVWAGGRLVAIDAAGGKARWEIDCGRLSGLEVVRTNDVAGPQGPPIDPNNPNVFNGNVVVNNGQLILNGNGRFRGNVIVRGGQVQLPGAAAVAVQPPQPPPAQPAPPIAGATGEQIVEVRPVGDRVLVSTTTGRLLSAELEGGRIAWQTRLSDRAPDRVVATEDFTVVKVSDDLAVRLWGLDTYSGRLLGPGKVFYTQTNATPVNLALSTEGTLVYTLPDRLCLKDLYKSWTDDERVVPGQPGLYVGATQPGQLVVAEGRILAVADAGTNQGLPPNEKYVRVHSLETGQPLRLDFVGTDGGKRHADQLLTSGAKDWNVLLRVVGPHLYVVGPQAVFGYNLDRPAETWKGMTNGTEEGGRNDANFRDAFIGQTHLVVLDQPVPAGGADAGPQYRLHAYGRYHQDEAGAPPGESGRLDYSVNLADPAGIQPQWQACDGGFCYATGDGKVRLLRGARQDAAAPGGAPATAPTTAPQR